MHRKSSFLGEYRQAFQNSNLILDFGYTEDIKRLRKKEIWRKHHFFTQFTKNFKVQRILNLFLILS